MRTVEMHLPPSALPAEMAAMRSWLDERRFEPSGFNCRERGAGVLVRLDFKVGREAEAFAEHFGGRVTAASANGAARIVQAELAPDGVVG